MMTSLRLKACGKGIKVRGSLQAALRSLTIDVPGCRVFLSALVLVAAIFGATVYQTEASSGVKENRGDIGFSDEVALVLVGGLQRPTAVKDGSIPVDLQLDLQCSLALDGLRHRFQCDEGVWGYAIEFNKADHEGKVTQLDVKGDRIRLQVEMQLGRDKWSQRGIADYEIELKKRGEQLEGTFRGSHNGRPLAGRAFGTLQSLTQPEPDFVPVAPGEHPRLLFRQQELPALRAKARSPVGQQWVAALEARLAAKPVEVQTVDDAVGYGLLYQLRADRKAGVAAREILRRRIETPIGSDPHSRPTIALWLAIAYDLVYETCDRSLRQQINDWLDYQASLLLLGSDRSDFNPTPWSNWNGIYRAALGTIALTLLGEPGQYAAAPFPPVMMSLEPPPQFLPGQGVPVNLLEPDRMPTQWLFVGPFHRQNREDVLAAIGGVDRAVPAVGTEVTYRGTTHRFQPLDPQYIWRHSRYTADKPFLDVANPVDRVEQATAYYYTVVENDQPRWLRVGVQTSYGDATLYLAGQRLVEDDAVYLEPGIYPLWVEAELEPRSGWTESTGMLAVEPRFIPTTSEAVQATYDQRWAIYERDRARWQAGYDAYRAGNKTHPAASRLNQIAARNIRRFVGTALGEWGWNSEGENYTQWTMELVLPYVQAYRNVIGIELMPAVQLRDRAPHSQTHLRHFLPLYIARSLYRDTTHPGLVHPGPVNPAAAVYMNSFGSGDRPAGNSLFAMGFNTVADTHKSAVLWAWNRLLGLEQSQPTKFDPRFDPKFNRARDIVFTLVNYPLDLSPQHPSQVLPLAIQDRQKGAYIFRNRWQDENDIVAQLYLKSEPRRAAWWYVGDGAFRIDGLGHSWIVKGARHKHQVQDRRLENVVQFSESINGWLGGQTNHFRSQADGSGTVSVSLDNSYLGQRRKENGKRLPLADLSAQILHENTVDFGIRGMRAFAADYSGVAGVPALFAVVDRISGGGEKRWQMIVAKEHRISMAGNVFTVTAADGATLQGTFVAPMDVELSAIAPQSFHYRNLKGQPQTDTVPLQGIQATGGDNFFVVMTLQNQTPPAVNISGAGLAATATVGKQTLCFIEDKISVGQCKAN